VRANGVFRRRRPKLAIAVFAVLALAAGTVWIWAFQRASDPTAIMNCPPPPAPEISLPYNGLDGVTPAPPRADPVQVLNAGGQTGLATQVAAEVQQYGFIQAGPAADDPLYPQGNLGCAGQIRFGPDGASAARTVSLLVPCAELIHDDRLGGIVDLVLGQDFTGLSSNADALTALRQLQSEPAGTVVQSDGASPLPSSVLAGARPGTC
jgi:LytR cell envelope-related transcriptional attenuator